MALFTLLFCPQFVLYSPPPPPILSPFQLSPSSNSFSPGLILMWLASFSSPSSPFSLLSSSSSSVKPPPPDLFFLKILHLMKLNSLVGSFFVLCVLECVGMCRGWIGWSGDQRQSPNWVCVCVCVDEQVKDCSLNCITRADQAIREESCNTHTLTNLHWTHVPLFLSLFCSCLTK